MAIILSRKTLKDHRYGGIYGIRCVPTGKIYVGQASANESQFKSGIYNRLYNHCDRLKKK